VTAKDTGVFLTDAGEEISVRTIAHHTPTAKTTLEPLYATDAELMDGARGELRGKTGESLRGTLRRQGNAFALHPEQPQQKMLEKTETTSPLASPPARRAKPTEKAPETTTLASPPVRRAKRTEKAPEAAPVASPPRLRAKPNEQTPKTAPSQAEAIEALKTIAQFLHADRRTVLETTAPVASEPPPSQAEAIEAARTVARFLHGDGRVELELAKHAQAIVGEFIAERERQMTAHDE
jgi:hypothetical protein